MVIYEKPNYIKVEYYPDKNYILFEWFDFMVSPEEIRELHEKALAAAQQNNCYFYVADTSRVHTVLRQEVVEWFGKVWVPRLVAAGLKAVVTVGPASAIATLSHRSWQAVVVGGITMKNVKTFADAEAAIKELQQLNRSKDETTD